MAIIWAYYYFAQEPLTPPSNPKANQNRETNEIHFTWDKPDLYSDLRLARTVLLIYNSVHRHCYRVDAHILQDQLSIRYFDYKAGDVCYAYIAFIDEETGRVSDSIYAGTLIMEKD